MRVLRVLYRKTLKKFQTLQNPHKLLSLTKPSKQFDQGVPDHDVLVDLVHVSEGGKIIISPKLELCHVNQDQIRNQRPRLNRNTQFLGWKAGAGVCKPVPVRRHFGIIIFWLNFLIACNFAI